MLRISGQPRDQLVGGAFRLIKRHTMSIYGAIKLKQIIKELCHKALVIIGKRRIAWEYQRSKTSH